MNDFKLLLHRRTAALVVAACWSLLIFSGCQSESSVAVSNPVFYPAPPEQPRLQFLRSFSGPSDVGVKGPSGFEKFVTGASGPKEELGKPYGVAIWDGRLYVCDVGKRMVAVLDIKNRTSSYLTADRRLVSPMNIHIDNGTKYVADSGAGAVFVFDERDELTAILGKELGISPLDVVVRGQRCYVTDGDSNQVVILDKSTGKEISRIGQAGESEGQFGLIGDLAIDDDGNIYVTDKLKGQIVRFDKRGVFDRTFGRLGDGIDQFVRPKGVATDSAGRIWAADAATEVVKILDREGRLLLFFGFPGNRPGMLNMPSRVHIDYDNVGLFEQYAAPGAKLEFLVLVANQYGVNKVNVYGFGDFERVSGRGLAGLSDNRQ